MILLRASICNEGIVHVFLVPICSPVFGLDLLLSSPDVVVECITDVDWCAGVGLSLLYLPTVVMVGYYFERRRGIAAGIACAGSGFGLLTLAPLSAWLVSQYTWKGCLTVLSGVSLNCLVWGALMRPLPAAPSSTVVKVELNVPILAIGQLA